MQSRWLRKQRGSGQGEQSSSFHVLVPCSERWVQYRRYGVTGKGLNGGFNLCKYEKSKQVSEIISFLRRPVFGFDVFLMKRIRAWCGI